MLNQTKAYYFPFSCFLQGSAQPISYLHLTLPLPLSLLSIRPRSGLPPGLFPGTSILTSSYIMVSSLHLLAACPSRLSLISTALSSNCQTHSDSSLPPMGPFGMRCIPVTTKEKLSATLSSAWRPLHGATLSLSLPQPFLSCVVFMPMRVPPPSPLPREGKQSGPSVHLGVQKQSRLFASLPLLPHLFCR